MKLTFISQLLTLAKVKHVFVEAALGRQHAPHNGIEFYDGNFSLKARSHISADDVWQTFCKRFGLRANSTCKLLDGTEYSFAFSSRSGIDVLTQKDPRGKFGELGNVALVVDEDVKSKTLHGPIGTIRSELIRISTIPPLLFRRTDYEIDLDNTRFRKSVETFDRLMEAVKNSRTKEDIDTNKAAFNEALETKRQQHTTIMEKKQQLLNQRLREHRGLHFNDFDELGQLIKF